MLDLNELGERVLADPAPKPRTREDLELRVRQRRRRRAIGGGVLAVAVLAVGVGVGVWLLDRDSQPSVITDQPGPPDQRDDVEDSRDEPDQVEDAPDEPDQVEHVDPGSPWNTLGELFDRPATPEDEFPLEEFSEQWLWQPYREEPYPQADYEASRSIAFGEDLPAYVVPTEGWDMVCLFLTFQPPEWFPDKGSTQPVTCTSQEAFETSGLGMRHCGPEGRWVTIQLVPVGLSPQDVEPYGTLHPSGAAILFDAPTGPDQPVELEYAPDKTVTLFDAPFGVEPDDLLLEGVANDTNC